MPARTFVLCWGAVGKDRNGEGARTMAEDGGEGLRDRLRGVIEDVAALQRARSRTEHRVALALKLVVLLFALVAGVAQFLSVPDPAGFGFWNYAGVWSSVIIFLGGLVILIGEHRRPDELEAARRATHVASLFDEAGRDRAYLLSQLDRASELFQAMQLMRVAIELFIELEIDDEQSRVELLMTAVDPTLFLAFDFEFGEHWTVSVYRAFPDPDHGEILRCLASKRAWKRDDDALPVRAWPRGVGVAGIAYARGLELVIPDLADRALGSFDELPPNLARESDARNYRSMAAAPIDVLGARWGVAVATSNLPGRFDMEDEAGIRGAEAVRALAGMVALAVAARHRTDPGSSPSGGGSWVPGI